MPAALADILHQIKLKQKPYQIDFTSEGADDELKKLVDSQQARTLEDLEIMFDEEKLDFTSILKEFVGLKRLEINCLVLEDMFHLPILEMSDIVEGIPDTVETLVLTSLPIETSFDDLCAPNVKELVLSMCMFDKGMDGLIEAYFPNLTRLIMADGCCISQKKLNM